MKVREIRIYYECLEQAYHYFVPAVKKACGEQTHINLVRLSRLCSETVVAEKLATAIALKDPDAIITLMNDGVEVPLAWIEISTSVVTQDHVLQRFDSMIAAGLAAIPFIKIQASRESPSSHGGQLNFNMRETFQILANRYNTPSIQIEWPTTSDKLHAIRDEKYRACPVSDLGLAELLVAILSGIEKGKTPSDALWDYSTESSSALAAEIRENRTPIPAFGGSQSTRLYEENGRWVLKFNRWGHAMDPERGMAWFYCARLNQCLLGRLHDSDASDVSIAVKNFCNATGVVLPSSISPKRGQRIDITQYVEASCLNRAGLAIIWNCSEFTVADAAGTPLVIFGWTCKPPTGLNIRFSTSEATLLKKAKDIGEDEVTYVVATSVYPTNGFAVHSVSYPGAQGDFPILDGNGRSVKRTYVDIIAIKNQSPETIVSLTESKGSRNRESVGSDTEKVLSWRDVSRQVALLLGALGIQGSVKVLASTAYPGNKPVNVPNASKLDYVVLVDDSEWTIWAPLGQKVPGVIVQKGDTELPERFTF